MQSALDILHKDTPICFEGNIFGMQRYGGISRYFVKLARELIAMQYNLKIVAPMHLNQYLSAIPKENIAGKMFCETPACLASLRTIAADAASNFFLRKIQPKLVHETYYRRLPILRSKVPTVVTVYDMIHEIYSRDFSMRDPTAANKRAAVLRADHVICISEQTRTDLLDRIPIAKEKTHVIHLGCDGVFNASTNLRLPPCVRSSRPYILYVGHRRGYKNFDNLARAFFSARRLRENFMLVAFGGEPLSRSELEMLKRLGANRDSFLHLLGHDAQLSELYQHAELFVYPSKYEGFGLPPLEAMQNGCAVASSTGGSLPEVVGDAAVLFDPNSIDSIAYAIESILGSEQCKQRLIEAGKSRAKNFTWRECATSTINVYRQTIA